MNAYSYTEISMTIMAINNAIISIECKSCYDIIEICSYEITACEDGNFARWLNPLFVKGV